MMIVYLIQPYREVEPDQKMVVNQTVRAIAFGESLLDQEESPKNIYTDAQDVPPDFDQFQNFSSSASQQTK